jgi:ATP-binding protein involved in chromosome partitioning
MMEQDEVLLKLSDVIDPELEQNIVDLHFISGIDFQNGKVVIHFSPDTPACPILDRLVSDMKQAVLSLRYVKQVEVLIEPARAETLKLMSEFQFGGIGHLNKIGKVIAVMSGKCRARKCMVSSFIAIYLQRAGYKVGLLDADISARNICKMFFVQRPVPQFTPRAMLPAVTTSRIKIMALSVHLPDDTSNLNYHSPSVLQKIKEINTNVFWGDLDYLIVDIPSGTHEVSQEMIRSLNANGVVLVTSPHDLDGLVIKNIAAQIRQTDTRILGLVENLSDLDRSEPEFADVVFSPGHFEETAKSLNIPIMARIPIDSAISALCDQSRIEECQIPAFEHIASWIDSNL